MNQFILRAEALDQIEQGHFGASSFQREMLQVSKIDKIAINVIRLNDQNPLSEINMQIDYKIQNANHKDIKLDEHQALLIPEELI